MKFFLIASVTVSILALSYMSIHAYEGANLLECDIVEENRDGLIGEVYAIPVNLSSHPGAASGIFGAQTEAGGLMTRRNLQTPLWAAAQ